MLGIYANSFMTAARIELPVARPAPKPQPTPRPLSVLSRLWTRR